MTSGDEAARAATRRDDLRRRLRGTSGRGRKLRGLAVLLAPYRTRIVLMFSALVAGTAASLAPAPLAKAAIDSGILKGDLHTLDLVVALFIASALWPICACRSSATCRSSRWASTSVGRRACSSRA